MIDDQRTSATAELTLEDDSTTSRIPRKLPILTVFLAIIACGLLATTILFVVQKSNLEASIACETEQCLKSGIVVLESMNRNIDPCDNFFEYACGGWNRQQVIPDDQAEVNKFGELQNDLFAKLKELIERVPQANGPASYIQARSYYDACVDLDTINTLGATPLIDVLVSLGGWPVLGTSTGGNWQSSAFDFESLWATLRGDYNIDMIISASVGIDVLNSDQYILELSVPEFAAPVEFRERKTKALSSLIPQTLSKEFGRKFLLSDELEDKRQAYLQYMIDTAVALGADLVTARRDMNSVLEFEKQLAEYAENAEKANEDPSSTTIGGLDDEYYWIEWRKFFEKVMPASVDPPVTGFDTIINLFPSYVRDVNDWFFTSGNERVLANYMIWRLVNRMVPYLGEDFLTIYQRYVNELLGTSASAARWKSCVEQANTVFPHATGRMYVDEHFSADTKKKTTEMVGNLQSALKDMMVTSDWLQPNDRKVAQEKLEAMGVAVGFPDWLREDDTLDALYADLDVRSDKHFANGLNYRRQVAQSELGRLRKKVDKSLWATTGAAEINAFYSPFDNGIIIPAAILQPPFYHPDYPGYFNYGGIGVVLGHEITHGFDSNGRLFNKDGNVEIWWSYESTLNFVERAQCMVDQYSSYVLPENMKNVVGNQTEAENIADNGGLREAYKAFKNHGGQHRLPGLRNMTNDQLFFLSFSQIWCSVMSREAADYHVKYDAHSPGRFRVIGSLQNNEDFNRAFNCPTDSYMNRNPKCKVWY